jgi:hypothetical protein
MRRYCAAPAIRRSKKVVGGAGLGLVALVEAL